jgi:hypothetical protein
MQNLVTDEELISEGQYIIDIEITPVKSIENKILT